MGLPDDCEELTAARVFRDEYIKSLPSGEQLINDYYVNAPKIVAAINGLPNSMEIYHDLYEQLAAKSLELVNSGKQEDALRLGLSMFKELKNRYVE